MRRGTSNWGAYQPGRHNTSAGSRARRRQAAAAARRGGGTAPSTPSGFWPKAKRQLTKPAVFLAAAVTAGIGTVLTGSAESATGWVGHHVMALFTSAPPPPKPAIASVAAIRIGGGGTVVFAQPVHPTERQIEADTNSLTGPGVLPDESAVQVMVRNPGHATAYVTNVRVIKTCTAPLSGTVLFDPPQGNGGESDVGIGFDLDSPHPVPRAFSGDTMKLGGGYFLDHTVAILPGEPQTFLLYTHTSRYYCRFHFDMTVHVDDRTYHLTINRKGHPFEITAGLIDDTTNKPTLGAYQVAYVPGYQARTSRGLAVTAATPNFVEVDPRTWKQGPPTTR
ncbi:hypothetical protein [Streptomyces shenzhenensis]|uniref:hypothetical protein n=1 Tax=Streptomyces shenzhenensis TaxID=943815 RepID=UPI001F24B327|nr:hypothetical protein [Streptomyces shenzhenensis]